MDELGREVERVLAEAVVGSRGSVVKLVRLEDHHLPGQCHALRAAVPKGLDARGREADRVRVVPVGLEPAGREVHLRALQSRRARPEANRVAPRAAGSFKTIGIDAA